MKELLNVKNLSVTFLTESGAVRAVEDVSFSVNRGETVCIVGESGSGKSVTSLSVMRLHQKDSAEVSSEGIYLNGRDITGLSDDEMCKIRGKDISMVFQEPMTSLNPVFTCGEQLSSVIMMHQHIDKDEAMKKSVDILRTVGIPMPERRVREYPHQMSGGMCQRVMIAIAISCNPQILIADEPTTALDATIQAQVLELMKSLKETMGMSVLLITHDLGVVAEMAERVIVMYCGRIQEEASVFDLFDNPLHPYTQGLLKSIPSINETKKRLHTIEGTVPDYTNMPEGCRFHPRCKNAMDICRSKEPDLAVLDCGRRVRCWLYDKIDGNRGECFGRSIIES